MRYAEMVSKTPPDLNLSDRRSVAILEIFSIYSCG
jgi:hypothetical protein